jgi:hypothetical protein
MSMLAENPSVIVKRKNIQVVLDYCLENRIECKMSPRDMPEEWEIEFTVDEIMKAINLGMFLKEAKLELAGFGNVGAPAVKPVAPVAAAPKATRTRKEKEPVKTIAPEAKEEPVAPVANDIFNEEVTEEVDYFQEKKQEENLFM